ncbi:hypothetical protein, partial [Pseudomonas avellanae]|uniref:hypothetical protein n=1 Tax=Pseudomonas avellanae TaxID=46257 RepID=UPI001F51B442
ACRSGRSASDPESGAQRCDVQRHKMHDRTERRRGLIYNDEGPKPYPLQVPLRSDFCRTAKNLRLRCSGFLRSEIDEKLSTEIVGMSVGNFLKPLFYVACSVVVIL